MLSAKLMLFENYSVSSSMLFHKTSLWYSKKYCKKCVCFNEIIWLTIMEMRVKLKNRSHRHETIKPVQGMVTNVLNTT